MFTFRKLFEPEVKKTSRAISKEWSRNWGSAFGIDQPINYELLLAYFRVDPIIGACVDVTVDNVCSDGYSFNLIDEQSNPLHLELLESFAEKINSDADTLMDFLRNITTELVVFDDVFIEVIKDGLDIPRELYVLDSETMKINLKKNGELEDLLFDAIGNRIKGAYRQEVAGQVRWFGKNEVIHFNLNRLGGHKYGRSLLESIIFSAASKRFAEIFSAKFFENHKTRGIWSFKDVDDEQFQTIVTEIEKYKDDPQHDIYLQGEATYVPITTGEDMQFQKLLEYLRQQIMTAMLVPPILLSIPEGSNRANADIQMQAFDRRVSAIQTVVSRVINEIVRMFGFNDVEFKFERINKRDELREVQITQGIVGIATINERREMLGLPPIENGDTFEQAPAPLLSANSLDMNLPRDYGFEASIKGPVKYKAQPFKKVYGPMKKKTDKNPIKAKDEKKVFRTINDYLNESKTQIFNELDSLVLKSFNANKKIVGKDVVDRIVNLMSIDVLKQSIFNQIKEAFGKGHSKAEKELKLKLALNPEIIEFVQEQSFDRVKDLNEELKNDLRGELERALLNEEGIPQMKKRIRNLFAVKEARVEAIARTEMNRAMNYGNLKAYENSGLNVMKGITNPLDLRTTEICKRLIKKYSTKPLKLDAYFVDDVTKEKFLGPPFHVNCRTTILPIVKQ